MISDLSLWVSTFNWEPVELSGFFSVLNYILEVSIPLCWVHWESLWGAESEPTAAASDWPRAPSEQKQWIFLKMRKVIKILSGICGAWLLGAGRRKCVHPQQPLHHRQSAGQTAGQVVPVTDTVSVLTSPIAELTPACSRQLLTLTPQSWSLLIKITK